MTPGWAWVAVLLGIACLFGCVAALGLCWLYCLQGIRRVEGVASRIVSPRLSRHRAGSVQASDRAVAWALQMVREFRPEDLGHPWRVSAESADYAMVAIAQNDAAVILACALQASGLRLAKAEAALAEIKAEVGG